ncbi:hypothetical protein HYH02_005596 [Chlamydomonas schloesseri]|uniref:Protein FAM91A1 n=1 Tax=Chlamydomonas schloesseri TaxID=2026947 RepID=A0A835WLI9_9CHLO|nr:hypothetical protein HYH02_005596 [Chlamydomonas schloesseri]|eukprot:KAG2449449.1 hypothetical protein HYH02_005596 [Chlamydomonas schloesseri]
MASQDLFKRAFATGKPYEDQPPRIRNMFTPNEWKVRVMQHQIQRGMPWAETLACTVSQQQEYYEELVRAYRGWMRLFPYHLSEYVCRVARLTPFKYYSDMLAACLREERSYDRIPNFTAADALAITGVGRNEYIAALNACKARRLMWRVNINRDSIVREHLPTEPLPVSRLEPWWRVAVVNIGESEYRELGEEELAHLKTAALPPHAFDLGDPTSPSGSSHAGWGVRVRDLQPESVLRGLLRKGLVYLEVPVEPYDRFAIPPLEGFVSNKTTEAGDAGADPLEGLLYGVFVANSERMCAAELAGILGVGLTELQAALGVACRLGFATRVTDTPLSMTPALAPQSASQGDLIDLGTPTPRGAGAAGGGGELVGGGAGADGAGAGRAAAGSGEEGGQAGAAASAAAAAARQQQQHAAQLTAGLLGAQLQQRTGGGGGMAAGSGAAGGGGGVAVVVDAEATGYLMMGALSPGLKRHSVTLFEGGRVAGEEVVKEMIAELWASYAAGQAFEGDLLRLTHYCAALATLLEAVRASAGPGLPLELLRKESLAGLAPGAAAKVLHHAYCAVVPITPLPPPVLPLSPYASTATTATGGAANSSSTCPAYYGPTLEAASPWLQLSLYQAARCGPQSLVFVCGQRVWRLPHPLDRCTHALLTAWEEEGAEGSHGAGGGGSRARAHGSDGGATLVEAPFLLYTLNEMLSRTAVLVQPLEVPHPDAAPEVVEVPLPLPAAALAKAAAAGSSDTDGEAGGGGGGGAAAPVVVPGLLRRGGGAVSVPLQPQLVAALQSLGLAACVGHLRLMRTPAHPHGHGHNHAQQQPGPGASTPPASAGTTDTESQPQQRGDRGGAVTATAAAAGPGGGASSGGRGGGGGPWLPLSASLGVPLYNLELCKAVCRAAGDADFLSSEGRAAQLQAQLQLQNHLTKLLVQFSHASQDGSYGLATGPVLGLSPGLNGSGHVTGDVSPYNTSEPASGATGGAPPGRAYGAAAAATAAGSAGPGRVGGVLPLPALNLSFDGHTLQPIRLRDCVQGLGCLCQG